MSRTHTCGQIREQRPWASQMNQHSSGRKGLPELRGPPKGPKQCLPSVLATPPGTWRLLWRGLGQHLVVCALHSPGTGLLADEVLSTNLLHAVRAMGGRPAVLLPLPTPRTVSARLQQSPCVSMADNTASSPALSAQTFVLFLKACCHLQKGGGEVTLFPGRELGSQGLGPADSAHASVLLGC